MPEPEADRSRRPLLTRIAWPKIGLFLISLFLFILALTLMKTGARALSPLVQDRFAVSNAANSLGFGWLFAYVVMSGSPVAASALTFLDAGILDTFSAFTMISGSRLGASFIVLFIGFVYVLRGRNRSTSLSMGLLSFTVTGTLQIGVLVIGYFLLRSQVFDTMRLSEPFFVAAVMDAIFDPIVEFAAVYLPEWALFVAGLLIILGSFSLFDRCLPEMSLKESQVGRVSRLVYRPMVMFLLGALVTLVSMSVSVSVGMLVPLSHRGFIRRENAIPYIMGANITTFIDTLLAAVLLGNQAAVSVVMAEIIGVAVSALVILILFYKPYERLALRSVGWIVEGNINLALFMLLIFAVPIVLLLVA